MVKVSVCIPVYGVEKYIERCARSLFEQTMTDGIEFIFVNDCTKDNSIEILEKVLEEYPHRKEQVKIIHHEKNRGLVAARNTGLEHATGDYIIHCDSDDWVDPNMYEEMYNKAIATDADMVYCDYYVSTTILYYIPHKGTCEIQEILNGLLAGKIHGATWNKLFKRSIAHNKNIWCPNHIVMYEDLLRTSQMIKMCKKIAFINKPLYFYAQNSTSLVHNYTRNSMENIMEVTDFLVNKYGKDFSSDTLKIKKIIMLETIMVYSDLFSLNEYKKYSQGLHLRDFICRFYSDKLIRPITIFTLLACVNYPLSIRFYKFAKKLQTFILRFFVP